MKIPIIPTYLTCFLLQMANVTAGQIQQNTEPGTRNPELKNSFRIAFYNVENLFDTIDDPMTDDQDFLPGSRIPWTSQRYKTKLDHMARVISDLSEGKPVAVFGLCEIENRKVLDDLVASPAIVPFRYKIIHADSPDERGIDNAILYDEGQFQPLKVKHVVVDLQDDKTRNILYVKGISKMTKGDTLNIFVNHWPSRSEGQEVSEPKRIRAAEILKSMVDSVLTGNQHAMVVIMGDLNDEPTDKSVSRTLQAQAPADKPAAGVLYNLMIPLLREGNGTLYYKDWDLFDQIIISGGFWLKKKGLVASGKPAGIFSPDYLLFTNKEGVSRPNRTAAREYYGGYSDHLPVFLDLLIRK